ncbi:MAG: anti-sigma regulatory factor [Deltaproteobacteria bacterium]|nr:anti-sigma regulatory factor [Deltaproteobacteria bacterium]
MERNQIRIPVRNETGTAWSVMEARKAAMAIGFDEIVCQMIATAVSELANNIVKYAGCGEILMGRINTGGRTGIEVTARDRGPGIEDIQRAMADHYSSGNTLGLGLPGVKRMMDEFELTSEPGKRTTVTIRKWL